MMLKALLMSSRLGLGQSFIHHSRHHNFDDDASDVEHLAHNIGTWEVQGTFHLSSFTPFPIATSWLQPDSTLCSTSTHLARYMNAERGRFRGAFHCASSTFKAEGAAAFYKVFLFLCKIWKEFLVSWSPYLMRHNIFAKNKKRIPSRSLLLSGFQRLLPPPRVLEHLPLAFLWANQEGLQCILCKVIPLCKLRGTILSDLECYKKS